MPHLNTYRRGIIKKSFCFYGSVLVCLLVIIYIKPQINALSWVSGFTAGFLVSILNFYLMSRDMEKVEVLPEKQFKSYSVLRFFMRYILIAVAFIAVVIRHYNLALFVVGLLGVQAVMVVDVLMTRTGKLQ